MSRAAFQREVTCGGKNPGRTRWTGSEDGLAHSKSSRAWAREAVQQGPRGQGQVTGVPLGTALTTLPQAQTVYGVFSEFRGLG